jgi:predicted ribosome quality control (RQC) complex YloA/Tae2 family protein
MGSPSIFSVHNNFYFLRQLAEELNQQLAGFTLVSCFTQNKDELVIEFNNSQRSFFIRASLQSSFSCLTFPGVFNRARKNSLDLFLPLLMRKVESISIFQNERSFQILFEEQFSLIFKMHGNRANVLFAEKNIVKEIFRNHLKSDFDIIPSQLHREIDWSDVTFRSQTDIFQVYFTLGKRVHAYLNERGYDQLDTEQRWVEMQAVLRQLEKSNAYYLTHYQGQYFLSLLKFGEVSKVVDRPIEAINEFYNNTVQVGAFVSEKTRLLQLIRSKVKGSETYIAKANMKLAELKDDVHWQQWADLLMANLHRVTPGIDRVIVENFYHNNQPVEIPLKKEMTVQRNAELYYRKSKNRGIEIAKLEEAIDQKRGELERARIRQQSIEAAESLKELKTTTPKELPKDEKLKAQPFHEFIFQGFKIWVGKDARSNDELTLKHTFKEDLWLHAKDVPGSHVIIKYQSGKKFPKDVIERAAELAAYNSKRKTESLCPVAFTPKKFVRKRKGDPAGAVVVEREEVILVEPKL